MAEGREVVRTIAVVRERSVEGRMINSRSRRSDVSVWALIRYSDKVWAARRIEGLPTAVDAPTGFAGDGKDIEEGDAASD